IPDDEKLCEPYHHDRRDDRTENDVDRDMPVPLEKDGKGDAGQDPIEPEEAVADERSVSTQERGGKGGDDQPEQRRQAVFIGVDENADQEQQSGNRIVLKHHLSDAAQQTADRFDRWIHGRQASRSARCGFMCSCPLQDVPAKNARCYIEWVLPRRREPPPGPPDAFHLCRFVFLPPPP